MPPANQARAGGRAQRPAIKALVADLVPPAQRGTGYGWLNGTIGIVALPASLIAGILWQVYGPATPFLFGFVLAGLAVVLLLRMRSTKYAAL